jgi:geranylgeranyl reductase family protein
MSAPLESRPPADWRRSWDAVVVGAGPTGTLAAWHLARGGASVALIEREPLPRYKTCGGGVVWRARSALPVKLDPVIERECYEAELNLLDRGLSFRVRREVPVVTMTMRDRLDAALTQAAIEAGAAPFFPCALEGLDPTREAVELQTAFGRARARFVIAADGATGATARLAGWQEPLRGIPALEWEASVDPDTLRRFESAARFDFGVATEGYSWIFPKRERLSVGILSTRRGARGLAAELERALELAGVGRILHAERHGFVIPLEPRRSFARDRVLLAGDAAGLADPITCEGISNAVRSGELAARAILDSDFEPERTRLGYASQLESEILSELRFAHRVARFTYRRSALSDALLARLGPKLCEALADIMLGQGTLLGHARSAGTWLSLLRTLVRPGRA